MQVPVDHWRCRAQESRMLAVSVICTIGHCAHCLQRRLECLDNQCACPGSPRLSGRLGWLRVDMVQGRNRGVSLRLENRRIHVPIPRAAVIHLDVQANEPADSTEAAEAFGLAHQAAFALRQAISL
ncbi:hypothetical protein DL89DRAFT_172045 [Linderina pennispora]|uniref:Uncharacterized protein n=1 Tax=Linderina pennispora TaxID=61395 RepID=A0A1Y1W6G9_9FUNG|nr:uncharacterized protein DL89DRAFT_172045 [Linderina pennispora]ORX69143.1 hypothetical protein DL89DRAFT_172045 [Linderina pennispora]